MQMTIVRGNSEYILPWLRAVEYPRAHWKRERSGKSPLFLTCISKFTLCPFTFMFMSRRQNLSPIVSDGISGLVIEKSTMLSSGMRSRAAVSLLSKSGYFTKNILNKMSCVNVNLSLAMIASFFGAHTFACVPTLVKALSANRFPKYRRFVWKRVCTTNTIYVLSFPFFTVVAHIISPSHGTSSGRGQKFLKNIPRKDESSW